MTRTGNRTRKRAAPRDVERPSPQDVWRRPTLPGPFGPSTIGAGRLNFRVRNGNGWDPAAMVTKTMRMLLEHSIASTKSPYSDSSPRPISTGQLHTLLCFHFRPINLVVYQGPYLISQWEISSWSRLRA